MPPLLSVVIPAFNEERRLLPTLGKLGAYLSAQSYSTEVLIADDGSSDGTVGVVETFARTVKFPVRALSLEHRGKGHAVRVGMLEATGDFRFMCDADLAMPVDELGKFLPPTLVGCDVAIGSREAPGAHRYAEPAYRHLMGRVFNLWVRMLTVKGISDTQCGFKCFTARAAKALFSQQRLDGFGFDVEVLFLAQKGRLTIREVPIHWYHQEESKVKPIEDTFRMLYDAARVRWNYQVGRYRVASIREASEVEN